jgi:hypothetical protein
VAELVKAMEAAPRKRLKYAYVAGNGVGVCCCGPCIHDRVDVQKAIAGAYFT